MPSDLDEPYSGRTTSSMRRSLNRTQRVCLIGTAIAIAILCICPPIVVDNSRAGPGDLGFVPVWELEQRAGEIGATFHVDAIVLALRCGAILLAGLFLKWGVRDRTQRSNS